MNSFSLTGMNSFFLDTYIEAEGLEEEYKAGLVVGLGYDPHYSFKVRLHSKEYSASAEGEEPFLLQCGTNCFHPLHLSSLKIYLENYTEYIIYMPHC